MTELKVNLQLDSNCVLTVSDETGYYSSSNLQGFLPESSSSAPSATDFKLSQGKFINVVRYNEYNKKPYSVAAEILATTPTTEYSDSSLALSYRLKKDGNYTLYRLFVPTKDFYTVNASLFTGKVVYYVNGSLLYKLVNDVEVLANYATLIEDIDDIVGVYAKHDFLSTCMLNACRFRLNEELIHQQIEGYKIDPKLANLVDLLNITFNVLRYLEETGNYTQIQRVIRDLAICGGVCAVYLKSKSLPCNCHEV